MTDARSYDDLEAELIDNYHWFHRHAELSYQEFDTTQRIRELLERHGIDVLDTDLPTGLVAVIRGTASGSAQSPVVAIRGDIDALPLTEETGLPYASEHPGVMHACGHDVNLLVALGAAILLNERRDQFAGTVKVIFQPAEEVRADAEHPTGAVRVLQTGALDDVQAFFGTHDADTLPLGTVGVSAGAVSGAVDKFAVTITGQGTHAAHPDHGVNPITVLLSAVNALNTITGQSVDPTHPSVLTVTHIDAGETWNVVPQTAFFEGTVRTANVEDRERIHQTLVRAVTGAAQTYGASAEVGWFPSSNSVINDGHWADVARDVAGEVGLSVAPSPASLGGEDFSYFLSRPDGRYVPGVFVHVGAASAQFPPHVIHAPQFAPDPRAIIGGARFLSRLAERALGELRA